MTVRSATGTKRLGHFSGDMLPSFMSLTKCHVVFFPRRNNRRDNGKQKTIMMNTAITKPPSMYVLIIVDSSGK